MSRNGLLIVSLVCSVVCLSSGLRAQDEPPVAASDLAEAAAPATAPAVKPKGATKPPATESLLLGGLRKRIFTDRDAQQFRTEEEDVFAALEDAKEAGDITPEMSIAEKARVVFKRLQTKPENATAFAPLLKAKTREERLATVIKMAAAMKTIVRILENFESVFGEL